MINKIITIIKSIFIQEEIKPVEKIRVKKPKKILKVGSEEWLRVASDLDRDSYYFNLQQNEIIKNGYVVYETYYNKNKRLFNFDLVPKSQSNRNVRSYLEYTTDSYKKWQEIRNDIEKKNNGKCKYCFNDSLDLNVKHKTECHEVWKYDFKDKKQVLVMLEPLCVLCHKIKHTNQQAQNEEELNLFLSMYAIINDITEEQAEQDYKVSLKFKELIDNIKFSKLDISILKEYNIFDETFNLHSPEFNKHIEDSKKKNGSTD